MAETAEQSDSEKTEALITRLLSIFLDRDLYKAFLRYQGAEAQTLLDVLQWLLDRPGLDQDLRSQFTAAAQRLATKSKLYPTCYELKNITQDSQFPLLAGGFADIFKGHFEGEVVCLKAIRVYQTTRIEYIAKADRPQLAYEVADGLYYLHQNGIVHGDLKGVCPNILIDNAGRARLTDFGLSAMYNPQILAWTSVSSMSSKGGSVRWQAPELFDANTDNLVQNTERSDVYAWSCVCFEIFTGTIPFAEIHRESTVEVKIMAGDRPSKPQDSTPWHEWGLNASIWLLMEQCWDQDPDQRPTIPQIIARMKAQLNAPFKEDNIVHAMSSVCFRQRLGSPLDLTQVFAILDSLPPMIGSLESNIGGRTPDSLLTEHALTPVTLLPDGKQSIEPVDDDEDESWPINISLLSDVAVQLRNKVPRADHTKGCAKYEQVFTGKDIVSMVQSQIRRPLAISHGMLTDDRRAALQIARGLQSQLFFSEVKGDDRSKVQDNVEDVYDLVGDLILEGLPSGVGDSFVDLAPTIEMMEAPATKVWETNVESEIMRHLSETEIQRQNIIHNFIKKEEHYVQALDIVEMCFIQPLRRANPPVVHNVDEFINDVFGEILGLRESSRHLIKAIYVRQREEGPAIRAVGDVIFNAAAEFKLSYSAYIGHYAIAEKRLKDEMECNPQFKLFIEKCSRQLSCNGDAPRLDLKHFLNRPTEHLRKLPGSLMAILKVTGPENVDYKALEMAIEAIKKLQVDAQLEIFQSAMGRNAPGKRDWYGQHSEPVHDPLASPIFDEDRGYDVNPVQIVTSSTPVEVTPGTQPHEEHWVDEDDEDERFIDISLLSDVAVQLRNKVPRAGHTKGGVQYERAFTGKEIVSTIQSQILRPLAFSHGMLTDDRRAALQIARVLQSQLFFSEVEWESTSHVQDNVKYVYNLLNDLMEINSEILEELPSGVVTGNSFADLAPTIETTETPVTTVWETKVGIEITRHLSETEIQRQNVIHNLIGKQEQYVQDLDIVEMNFIRPLRRTNPPIIHDVDEFIDDVFGNILDLRECNRRLIEVMYVRQREEGPVIRAIGDIILDAAVEFRLPYPAYIGHHPIAEKRLKVEMEHNSEFKLFIENCSEQPSRNGDAPHFDLRYFLNRPTEHLQKLLGSLQTILKVTEPENADYEVLDMVIEAIKNLQAAAQLATFQSAVGQDVPGNWEWHDLVLPEVLQKYPKGEINRQVIIFELIKDEMAYVKDLESINNMYIIPLRTAEPPIIPRDRLEGFIHDVFHNLRKLYDHHDYLLKEFHRIQREQHPIIGSIIKPLAHASLQFREAYQDYISNYPIVAYKIDDEMVKNSAFKAFVESCIRHSDAHRLDMKDFINRPITRLLRYDLALKGILRETPADSSDTEQISETIDFIKSFLKKTEPGVAAAKQKVEVWRYNSNLLFKSGETVDMDLLNPNRSLVHSGKLLHQPESGLLEWNGWSEVLVLLFDNYMVMTKSKERDGVIKYQVNRRVSIELFPEEIHLTFDQPVPLDLLTLVNFTEAPTQRSTGILRGLRGGGGGGGGGHADGPNGPGVSPDAPSDSRNVYPLTLHHNGRTGGTYILYAESAQARLEWKQKLEEALVLRKVVQESNKVFEPQTLSADIFLIPSMMVNTASTGWNQDNTFTGKVTCSVPFITPNGRPLVAIGCAEGVWIGYQHDPKSMRRVLHLKMSLFAYHIEALVPAYPQSPHNQSTHVPQKLNGNKDVHFFSVGTLHGRTLIIYMKKKGLESIFRALEPVGDKINEQGNAPVGFGSRL
ncbi:hypothetical protein C0995_010826, partial [Termitomyces sp. Mi166